MSPVSLEFAAFVAFAALIFYAIPAHWRWGWLTLVSYLYYASWNLVYVPLLMFTTVCFYLIGGRISGSQTPTTRRNWLILGVALSLLVLFTFQYLNFFSQSFGAGTISALAVPIGISFYTFAGIGYLVDIFRGTFVQSTPGKFALFIALFPTVTSGPIERAGRVIPQFIQTVTFDESRTTAAFRQILWGVFKKLVIADRLGIYVSAVYADPQQYNGLILITATLFYAFQIYADFSGYSDVAIGVAKLFGIDIIENFKQPYFAMSVRDFWTRWHISLSTWIRDYMFMPLSRNWLRSSDGKYPRLIQGMSNLIVMILVGLWHGPGWSFVIWGALHGVYLSIESILGLRVRNPKAPLWVKASRIAVTFVLVCVAWVFFRAANVQDALYILTNLFTVQAQITDLTLPFAAGVLQPNLEFMLSLGLIVLLIGADWLDANRGLLVSLANWRLRWAVYYALGAGILLALVYGASTGEFIYFQF